jgi:FMN-dependent NADH-azoreductase
MPTLLSIQASSRGDASVSRILSDKYVEQWKHRHPDGQLIVRDLMKTDLPFVDNLWITGAYTPDPEKRSPEMRAALSVSDELIAELRLADHILIGVPMLNFGIPAVLKAYIDQIVRLNETFSREAGGVLKGKVVKIILASGRVYTAGSPDAHLDFASGFLKEVLGYIGITDVEIVFVGGALGIARGIFKLEDHIARFEPAVREMVGKTRPEMAL